MADSQRYAQHAGLVEEGAEAGGEVRGLEIGTFYFSCPPVPLWSLASSAPASRS
jgi:hypothetical protein